MRDASPVFYFRFETIFNIYKTFIEHNTNNFRCFSRVNSFKIFFFRRLWTCITTPKLTWSHDSWLINGESSVVVPIRSELNILHYTYTYRQYDKSFRSKHIQCGNITLLPTLYYGWLLQTIRALMSYMFAVCYHYLLNI